MHALFAVFRFVFKKFPLILVTLTLLLGCQKKNPATASSGTAEGFGGDDFYREMITGVRAEFLEAELASIATAPSSETFCDFQAKYCQNDPTPLCYIAPTLSDDEKITCNSVVRSIASSALVTVRNPEVTIETTSQRIFVDADENIAKTNLSGTGEIFFHTPTIKDMGYDKENLAVLLMHEMMHKTLVNGAYLKDTDVYGNFSGIKKVRDLFTAVGYAVVFRHIYHYAIQVGGQFPSAGVLTTGLRKFDGKTSYPPIASSSNLHAMNDFTWSFMIQTLAPQKDLSSNLNALFAKSKEGAGINYFCDLHNHTDWFVPGKIECGFKENGAVFPRTVTSLSRVDDGEVHTVLFVKAGTEFKLYIDGRLDASYIPGLQGTNYLNTGSLTVGERTGAGKFSGNLGVLQMWKTIFSPSQLDDLFDLFKRLFPYL